jgi:hypothetical protein
MFAPHLSPVEMLQRGIFGGGYFHKASDADLLGLGLPDDLLQLNRRAPRWDRNAYGVKSGMNHAQWIAKGWIFPEDPMGWFHWYCRYSAGRRHFRDAHQIARQERFFAATSRFGMDRETPVVKQSLIQWGWDPDILFGEE